MSSSSNPADVSQKFLDEKSPDDMRHLNQNLCLLIVVKEPLLLEFHHKIFKVLIDPLILKFPHILLIPSDVPDQTFFFIGHEPTGKSSGPEHF